MKKTRIWGFLFILGVVIVNEYVAASFFSPDGELETTTRICFWILDISWLMIGICCFCIPKRDHRELWSEHRQAMFEKMIPLLLILNFGITFMILYMRWSPLFFLKEEMILTLWYFSSMLALYILSLQNAKLFSYTMLWNTIHAGAVILITGILLTSFLPLESTAHYILNSHPEILELPKPVKEDLSDIQAVIGNAWNPTRVDRHDTILVKPDNEFGYVLRADTTIHGWLLKTTKPFNMDPPVLYIDSRSPISNRVNQYIEQMKRNHFVYHVNSDGYRMTLPEVQSDQYLLVIGDSVGFGIGVNDEDTVASCLQDLVTDHYQVINASVGGYTGRKCALVADREAKKRQYSGLIYVLCNNDFPFDERMESEIHAVMKILSSVSDLYRRNVIIVAHQYMDYTIRDVYYGNISRERVRYYEEQKHILQKECEKYGFSFSDWSMLVDRFQQESKSVFSRFALYADHCHLSPLGNQYLAKEIYDKMNHNGLVYAAGKENRS